MEEKNRDHQLEVGMTGVINRGFNDKIPTNKQVGRNAYLERLRKKLLLLRIPQYKHPLYILRHTTLIRFLRGHTPL